MKKTIAFLALGTIGAGVYLYLNFNNIALQAAEKVGTQALGVTVDIGDLDVDVLNKKVTVSNISVDNPEGYSGRHLMEIKQIDIGLHNLTKELIDFKNVDVHGSVINVEINEKGMNIHDLKTQMASKKKGGDSSETAKRAINVIVQKATIGATTINTSATFFDEEIASLTMPKATFRNVGTGKGIDAKDALNQIFSGYMDQVQVQVSKNNLLDSIEVPGLQDTKRAVDDAADSVTNTLKGLF